MNHKQIWTEIAEAYYLAPIARDWEQQTTTNCGLCFAYQEKTYENVLYRLGELCPDFWFGSYGVRKNDIRRGDMATLFSCMTKREFNQLRTYSCPT